eukprot:10641381-Alexandrium_andersonii.AAC.1
MQFATPFIVMLMLLCAGVLSPCCMRVRSRRFDARIAPTPTASPLRGALRRWLQQVPGLRRARPGLGLRRSQAALDGRLRQL